MTRIIGHHNLDTKVALARNRLARAVAPCPGDRIADRRAGLDFALDRVRDPDFHPAHLEIVLGVDFQGLPRPASVMGTVGARNPGWIEIIRQGTDINGRKAGLGGGDITAPAPGIAGDGPSISHGVLEMTSLTQLVGSWEPLPAPGPAGDDGVLSDPSEDPIADAAPHFAQERME